MNTLFLILCISYVAFCLTVSGIFAVFIEDKFEGIGLPAGVFLVVLMVFLPITIYMDIKGV